MKYVAMSLVVTLSIAGFVSNATGDVLGTAQHFAVLAGSTVTNTGPTRVTGALGVWPGESVTGFPAGVVVGTVHAGDAFAYEAQLAVTAAYDALSGMAPTQTLTGTDLGGLTLTPGVYFFASSAFLTGSVTLDGLGDPDARFVFQIGSTLGSASNASVLTINGASPCNVYWQVGSSATLATDTAFKGNILAMASITLDTGATLVEGRALARTGAVTMDTNLVTFGCAPCDADFDGDGFVSGIDFDLFVLAFEAGDFASDFDHDGFITGVDFDSYVQAFELGC